MDNSIKIHELQKVVVSSIRDQYAKGNNDEGTLTTLAHVLDHQLHNSALAQLGKEYHPCLQNNTSGYRLNKDSLIHGKHVEYLDYWNGLCFIDIDNKIGWSNNQAQEYAIQLHNILCSKPWYIWTTMSSSGSGIHVIGYIQSIFHTLKEFRTTMAVMHSACSDALSVISGLSVEYLYDMKVMDCCTFNSPQQLLKYTYAPTWVNENFHINSIPCIVGSDSTYYELVVEGRYLNDTVKARLLELESPNQYQKSHEIKTKTCSMLNWSAPPIQNIDISDRIDFRNNSRLQLVYTLRAFLSVEDTLDVCSKIYQSTYGTDAKYEERMQEMTSIATEYNGQKPNLKYVRLLRDVYNIPLGYDLIDKNAPNKNEYDLIIDLGNDYLSARMNDILKLDAEVIVVDSPAGSGKTQAISRLDCPIMMVEPYTSIIKNKIEKDEKLKTIFGCLYGKKRIYDGEFAKCNKFCATPDNISRIDADTLKRKGINHVFVDESHTIYSDSSFRIKVMTSFVEVLLSYIENGIKVIFLSGTPLFEEQLFTALRKETKIKRVEVNKSSKHSKILTIKRYETNEAKRTAMLNDIVDAVRNGYKCIVPTNEGDKVVNSMIDRINERLGYSISVAYTYYTRNNKDDKLNTEITDGNSIDDVNVVFAGTSMSVGIDIYSDTQCKVFFYEATQAYMIEQFSARLRNTNKECYLYITDNGSCSVDIDYIPLGGCSKLKLQMAKYLVDDVNMKNALGGSVQIEQHTMEEYPYICYDYIHNQYEVKELSWYLEYYGCQKSTYYRQLSAIKRVCEECYGFIVNDDYRILTVAEEEIKLDKQTKDNSYNGRKTQDYKCAKQVQCCETDFTKNNLLVKVQGTKEKRKMDLFNRLLNIAVLGIKPHTLKMILDECIDDEKKTFDTSLMNTIHSSIEYFPSKEKIRSKKVYEMIVQFVKSKPTCRRETYDEFIKKLAVDVCALTKIVMDKTQIDRMKKVCQGFILKETIPNKRNSYTLSIRPWAEDMFNGIKREAFETFDIWGVN